MKNNDHRLFNVQVSNLGPIKKANFDVGDLTIICGRNNTGKTYSLYALYGFLSMRNSVLRATMKSDDFHVLKDKGTISLDLQRYVKEAKNILQRGCKDYSTYIPKVFAANQKLFSDVSFELTTTPVSDIADAVIDRRRGGTKHDILTISKEKGSMDLLVTMLLDQSSEPLPERLVQREVSGAIIELLLGQQLPNSFIASAERTGAAIFRTELDFARNHILRELSNHGKDIDPLDLFTKSYSNYALPVQQNVDFTRGLEGISKHESFILREHPEVLDMFKDIIGGEYRIVKDNLVFVPNAKKSLRLSMDESSSAVRSMLDIGFYLRHVAEKGDLLFVDEPELNLHPGNQRRVARLFSKLLSVGLRVFITTHSDYLVKELNTLIMLHQRKGDGLGVRKKFGYDESEGLDPERLRVYFATTAKIEGVKGKHPTLVAAVIDPVYGVKADSFDDDINQMNEIQDELLFDDEA